MPITPFLSRSKSLLTDPVQPAASSKDSPARPSTSSVFPSLQKLNTNSQPSRPQSQPQASSSSLAASNGQPTPLVSFRLSGPSFLDVVIRDRADKEPLYIIETIFDATSVYRLDHATDRAHKVATIQWPSSITKSKVKSGRSIQMADGRWRDAEEFLKLGPLGSVATRKFNIPHYPHGLKWKLIPGGHFYCSTAGANGPFAILDSAVLNAPARISVFHNCLEQNETRYQESYKGVPVLLLDYLITTALLLVTEVQEWLDRPQTADGSVRMPGSSSYAVQRWLAIIHGEPIPPSPTTSPAETTASVPWTMSDHRRTSAASSGPRSATTSDFSSMPSTPATSVHSSFFSSGQEEVPPVPPLPDLSRFSHQEYSGHEPLYRNPYALGSAQSLLPPSPPATSRGTPIAPLRPSRLGRQLPTPPQQALPPPPQVASIPPLVQPQYIDPSRSPDFMTQSAVSAPRSDRDRERERARSPSPSLNSTTSSGSGGSRRSHLRNSARSSLGSRSVLPPPMPPPSDSLPLPPKLAQEYQAQQAAGGSSSRRTSGGYTSSPLGQLGGGLLPSNPDPVDEEEQERIRQATEATLTRQYQRSPQPAPAPPLQSELPEMFSPPPALPVESFARLQVSDGGPVRMRDALARQSYAETIYEMPPPAYDSINFSAPHVPLPQRGHPV